MRGLSFILRMFANYFVWYDRFYVDVWYRVTITPDIIKEILSRNCIFHDCRNGCVKWDLRILERPHDSQIVGCSGLQPIGGITYSCCTCNADVCTICRQFCHGDHEVNIVFEDTSYFHEKKCACEKSGCKSQWTGEQVTFVTYQPGGTQCTGQWTMKVSSKYV